MSDQEVKYTLSLEDLLTWKLKEADSTATRLNGTMGALKGAIAGIGLAMGVSFGMNAINNFAQSVVQAGTTVENAQTGLTTMLKNADEAKQVIADTMTDATKTPFAFEGLLAANKALIGANVEAKEARKNVLDLANAIAATGGGDDELGRMVVNMQQIKNVGQATAMDIKQFAFAGINIYEVLAKATGKPISAVKDMTVTYELLTSALAKAHATGGLYANGLENMAGNTSVRISNLGDAMFQLKVKMFNDLKPAIDWLITGMGNLIEKLRIAWGWMVEHKTMLKAVGTGVIVATGLWLTYTLAIQAAAWATKAYTALQWLLNIAMDANPIGVVILAIGALVAAFKWAYDSLDWFRAGIWATWAVLKEFASIVYDVFSGLANLIEGVFTFDVGKIKEGLEKHTDVFFNAGKRLYNAFVQGGIDGMADFAKDHASTLVKPKDTIVKKGAPGRNPLDGTAGKNATASAAGSKNITINIKIDNLIKDFSIQTKNVTEGAGKIKEMVAQALLSAVNDSQIVAGS